MLALLDSKVRGVGPDNATGGRIWDNYSWHADLAPGQPMVGGIKAIDSTLELSEHADLILVWGMNRLANKMAAGKWLTEAQLKKNSSYIIRFQPNNQSCR